MASAVVERDNIEIGTFSQLDPSSSGCSLRAKVLLGLVILCCVWSGDVNLTCENIEMFGTLQIR